MSDSKEIANIQEEITRRAKALADSIPTTPVIGIDKRSGNFRIGDIVSQDNVMDVVILDFIHANSWWEKPYSPDNSEAPDCFALGKLGTSYSDQNWDEMSPVAGCPNPQANNCKECPMNQFGSAPNGRGKACSNNISLALLPAGNPEGKIHTLRMSPSAIRSFNSFLRKVTAAGKLPVSVVVPITTVEAGASWAFHLDTDRMRPNEDLAAFYSRIEGAKDLLEYVPKYENTPPEVPTPPVRKQ